MRRLNGNGDKVMAGHEGGVLLFLSPLCFVGHSTGQMGPPFVASVMWDGANVSGHVASHTRTRPPFHGTLVAPSGRLPVVSANVTISL